MNLLAKILIVLSACLVLCNSTERQSLGGTWTVTGSVTDLSVDATVPGGIYSDLMNSGSIGDVFYGDGDTEFSWVGLNNWTYSSTFQVEEELLNFDTINIVFDGVDTFATIKINGYEIGTTQNMFVRYVYNVKELLQVGDNTIEVQLESSRVVADALEALQSSSYLVPPTCQYGDVCNVNEIRKMQSSFAWDWGPAFPSLGIWKEVYLEAFNSASIRYVVASVKRDTEIMNYWIVNVTTYFGVGRSGQAVGNLTVALRDEFGNTDVTNYIEASLNEYSEVVSSVELRVEDNTIKLWWPNGYGEQTLYNLTVTFTTEDEFDTKTIRIGFRTVELVQDELESGGLTFYFKVNDLPIFAKGSNEIPINILPEKGQDPAVIRRTLQSAKDVHINMLRVWGGGVYESDYFYDLTDEFGILIWQDFMFACAMYPSRPGFLANVQDEVRNQVKRIGSHPSIAIWSGNNENELALIQDWYGTYRDLDRYKSDYVTLYVETIKPEFHRILPNANFITSSPSNGLESESEGYISNNPGDGRYGDVHYYNYGDDGWDSRTFPIPRFASEYGYQSMPSLESWLTATDVLEEISPFSDFMNHRQHHPDGNNQNINLIEIQFPLPDRSSDSFNEAFIYYSQILQAQAIKTETEHYRSFKGRLTDDGQGYTMGALYWQLNDVWVAPTWSGTDFVGRWKMLQYFSKNFFSPLIVTTNIISEDNVSLTVEFLIVNDLPELDGTTANFVLHVYQWDSFEPLEGGTITTEITLDFESAVGAQSLDLEAYLPSVGCEGDVLANCFIHFHVRDANGNDLAPTNYFFPSKLKNSNVPNAIVEITSVTQVDDDGNVFDITVTTDAIALFVWLDSHEILGRFSDNGFLQVSETKTVTFTAEEPLTEDDLSSVLTVTHLRDPKYLN